MNEKNIKISSGHSLPDVVGKIQKGEWKIPRFQREFVWEKSKVVDLLDSMYKEFPIGSFFLWIPPEEYSQFYKDIPELNIRPDGTKFYTHFILDGQQRLTSLYVTAEGLQIDSFNYGNICFDLDTEKFNVGPPNSERNISVHQIIHADKYLGVYNALTDDRKRAYMKVNARMNSYPFPVITIENKNIEEACKIFERINQGGKRLNIFDLVIAVTWDKDFELKEKIDEFNTDIAPVFGKIENEVFTEAISLIINKQCTKAFQLKLTPQSVKERWETVEKAIGMSVQFLRTNLRIPNYSYLPYRDIIALVAYYFHECWENGVEVDKKFLEDWFWKVSFSNRYSGSSFTKIGEDRATIFDRKIRCEPYDINYDITVNEDRIKTVNMGRATALRNALLLVMIQQTPLSFQDSTPVDVHGDPISSFNKSERHHIFPKAFLKSVGIKAQKSTDLLVNFGLIDSTLNKEISCKPPSIYFTAFKNSNPELGSALRSHLIPEGKESGIWDDNYSKFIDQRAQILSLEVQKRTGKLSTVQEQMLSSPEKLIQKTEQVVRETISQVLYDAHGEDWWTAEGVIPQDVDQYVREKIKREKSNKPYIQDPEWSSPQRRLEQVNMMDYPKIILRNWNFFEDVFGSKRNLEKRFEEFSTLRNQIDHVKTLDPIEMKLGETAIDWIFQCIRPPEEKKTLQKGPGSLLHVNELYQTLKAKITALDREITEKSNKKNNSFNKRNNAFNFVRMRFRKDHLIVWVWVGKDQVPAIEGIGVDRTRGADKARRRISFTLNSTSQLNEVMRLIDAAYLYNERYILKNENPTKKRHAARLEFWKGFLQKAKDSGSSFGTLNPRRYHWLSKSTGRSGLRYVVVIFDDYGRVELYIDTKNRETNKNTLRSFQEHKTQIENAFGAELNWEPLPNKRASRISFKIEGGLSNKAEWDQIQSSLISQMRKLEEALQSHIAQIGHAK